MSSQLIHNLSQSIVQPASQPIQLFSQLVQLSSQPIQLSSQPIQLSSQPIQLPSQPIQLSSQPIQLSSQPIQLSSQPIQLSSQPISYHRLNILQHSHLPRIHLVTCFHWWIAILQLHKAQGMNCHLKVHSAMDSPSILILHLPRLSALEVTQRLMLFSYEA